MSRDGSFTDPYFQPVSHVYLGELYLREYETSIIANRKASITVQFYVRDKSHIMNESMVTRRHPRDHIHAQAHAHASPIHHRRCLTRVSVALSDE